MEDPVEKRWSDCPCSLREQFIPTSHTEHNQLDVIRHRAYSYSRSLIYDHSSESSGMIVGETWRYLWDCNVGSARNVYPAEENKYDA